MRLTADGERTACDKNAKSNMHGIRESWVGPYMKRYGGMLAAAIAISALAYVFAAGLMFTSGYMISLAAALPLTVLVLHLPSIFVRIFGIGKPLLSYAERLISHNWVLRMTSEMRRALYDALERKSFALRSKESLGRILALLTEDIGHVQDLFLKSVIPLATSWLVALLLVICAGIFSLQLALLYLAILAVVVVAMPAFSIASNAARLAQKAQIEEQLYEKLADDVEGLSDWVLSGNISGYMERAVKLKARKRDIEAKIRRYGRWHDLLAQAFFAVCIAALVLWASCVFGSVPSDADASLSTSLAQALGNLGSENSPAYAPNWIAAFVLCFFPLIEAFAPASHAAMDTKTRLSALRRMEDFSADDARVTDGRVTDDRMKNNRATVDHLACHPDQLGHPAPSHPDIAIENLSFSYPGSNRETIRDANLHIAHGEHIAILGKSGAGKTTLAAILHGDYAPTSGSCIIDGLKPMRSAPDAVGVVSQDPYIFNLSLRDNLKLANPKASDMQLIEALRAVGLQDRFEKLPRGLDSVIERRGMNLSGGEAHRVAVARILLAKQPIVVLDEPFAGLDQKTERALLDTILKTLGDRTIITITHHLDNIELFDRVVFMQDSAPSIAFSGTPEELARDPRYEKLLKMSAPTSI